MEHPQPDINQLSSLLSSTSYNKGPKFYMTENRVKPQPGLNNIAPYKPGRPIEEVQKQYGIKDVIKMASNENPLGPSPKAVLAIQEALLQLNMYPDGQSCDLRLALAEKYGLHPNQITIGNGADGLIQEICMAFLADNCDVIVSASSFPVYDLFTRAMRARLVKTPLTPGYGIDLKAFSDAVTERTKIIFVCNPNNPTGTVVHKNEVDNFIHKIPDNILVVLDEAYYEFNESEDFPDSLGYIREGHKNILVMRTFSKVYGLAGIRIGYAFADEYLINHLNTIKEPFAVNRLAQIAGIAALQDEEFTKRSISETRFGKEYLYKEFERMGLFHVKSHTNFILVEIGSNTSQVIDRLMQMGVIIRPCTGYNLPTFARITVGNIDQNKRLIKSLEELLRNNPG
jgi:histidinol-phosphate aminotransferase